MPLIDEERNPMNDIKLDWITRIETPCDTVIYLSPTRRQLFLANRRLDAGGEPLAAVDLAKPLSGELPELIDLTKWYMTEHVKADDPSFVPSSTSATRRWRQSSGASTRWSV